MNQVRSGRYYYPEEFEPRPKPGRWLLLAAVLTSVLTHTAAFVGGDYFRGLRDAEVARIAASIPPRARPAPAAALTQWACTKAEFREYREACAHRALSAAIKPKE